MQNNSMPLGHQKNQLGKKEENVDFGQLGLVFIACAILSLLTAWVFSMETEKILHQSFRPLPVAGNSGKDQTNSAETGIIGPIKARKRNEVFSVGINASIPVQTWAFVEGEVLNQNKEYLFAFGKELWSETGRDSEGRWSEKKIDYKIKVTFPEPGEYFFNFKSAGNTIPNDLKVKIVKKRGSALPHFWFGLVALVIGLILNEIKNKTILKILDT